MKKLNLVIAAVCAASLLTACGGGGSSTASSTTPSATPTPDPTPSTPSTLIITVSAQSADSLTVADCARLASDSQSAAALDLSNASVKAINDLLLSVDPTDAYPVFIRRPHDFVNWIVSISGNTGVVDVVSLGTATHETLHMVDDALRQCGPAGQEKYQFFDQQLITDLTATSTSPYGIVAETIDASLTSAPRYQTYIVNLGSTNANDFRILLDEFAAYTAGAYTELQYLASGQTSTLASLDGNLGGTVNFMVYLEYYLKSARVNHAATYTAIQGSMSTKAAIQALWSKAEQVLQASYAQTKPGASPQLVVDGAYFSAAYSAGLLAELDALGIAHASAASWSGTYLP